MSAPLPFDPPTPMKPTKFHSNSRPRPLVDPSLPLSAVRVAPRTPHVHTFISPSRVAVTTATSPSGEFTGTDDDDDDPDEDEDEDEDASIPTVPA